jgi:hypothetical protein
VALLSFLGLIFAGSPQAAAQFHVAQPDVVKGEVVVGDHAAVYFDHGTEEKLRQGHEVEAIYDFTERFELIGKDLFLEPIVLRQPSWRRCRSRDHRVAHQLAGSA